MTEQLYLSNDVYVCVTEGHGVFLDLKRDKYSAIVLPGSREEALERASVDGNPTSLVKQLTADREDLIKAGLLTTDPASGRPIEGAKIESVDGHIFGIEDTRLFGVLGEAANGLNITLGEMWQFFSASWKASRELKSKHLSRIVERIRRRKARAGNKPADIEKVRRLTSIYRRLRPWYPRKYLCLYDSLALVEFMARRNVYPLWVFAVHAQPFGAHCWVQNTRLLLNESTEFAGQFTPIMAV